MSGGVERRRPASPAVGRRREGSRAAAAALACAGAEPDRAGLLVDLDDGRAPRPTLVASAAARELEERLAAHLPEAGVASRGQICHLALPADPDGLERVARGAGARSRLVGVVHLPPAPAAGGARSGRSGRPAALLRADLDRGPRPTALAVRDLIEQGLRPAVLKRPSAGSPRGGRSPAPSAGASARRSRSPPARGCWRHDASVTADALGESGQALPLALGRLASSLIAGALALVAIAGAVTGKGRVQRAADLAAISAARSMRDDLPRLLSPPTLPNGLPNPAHMEKVVYLLRARAAAFAAATANGVGAGAAAGRLPRPALLRAGAGQGGGPRRPRGGRGGAAVEASAVAEAAAPPGALGPMPAMASGGGYSRPARLPAGEPMP